MRRVGRMATVRGVAHVYPPLNVEIRTPRLTLAGASDDLLERLVPLVRAGIADVEPWPFDDPISFYADNPEREWRWLRAIWSGRGRVSPDAWRLYFAVLVDGEPVGMQDLIGRDFARFATVTSFSWLAPGHRGRGLGKEMRSAILHLAFAGLGAREGVLILLLKPYGVTGADAVALSFIQLGGTLILAILGGLYEFRSFWRRQGEPEVVPVPSEPPLVGSSGESGQHPGALP